MKLQGYDRALILQALYNASTLIAPMAILTGQAKKGDMSLARSYEIIKSRQKSESAAPLYFDYLDGRLLKVNLTTTDNIDFRYYDRDNGPGAGERAVRQALPVQQAERARLLSVIQAYIDKPRPSAWQRLRNNGL